MQQILIVAGVYAQRSGRWGWIVREDDPPVKGRFVHSCDGPAGNSRLEVEMQGVLDGLRWIVQQGRCEIPLKIVASELIAVGLVGRGEAWWRHMDMLDLITTWEAKAGDVSHADQLARAAWESAARRPFPGRPTRQRQLPGMRRAGETPAAS